jgi:hypothetical protein
LVGTFFSLESEEVIAAGPFTDGLSALVSRPVMAMLCSVSEALSVLDTEFVRNDG